MASIPSAADKTEVHVKNFMFEKKDLLFNCLFVSCQKTQHLQLYKNFVATSQDTQLYYFIQYTVLRV